MPCFHPIEVPIVRKSIYTEWRLAYNQTVPCGSCIGCRAEQGRQWAVRMLHEARLHASSVFVTLTLDDGHLNENRELCAKDFSGFIKSLRKTQERRISFFGCGEYGETSGRPHYHALLFGIDFLDRDYGFDGDRPHVWRSETLESTWGRGLCEGGTVTMASASYVAGYIRKKVKDKHYSRITPEGVLKTKEFSRMSLRPAIGKNWIERYWRDVYPRDFIVVDGKEAKPPRYYDKFMDLEDENGGDPVRREVMEEVRTKRYDEAVDLTAYQMQAGEAIARSRTELFARRNSV